MALPNEIYTLIKGHAELEVVKAVVALAERVHQLERGLREMAQAQLQMVNLVTQQTHIQAGMDAKLKKIGRNFDEDNQDSVQEATELRLSTDNFGETQDE